MPQRAPHGDSAIPSPNSPTHEHPESKIITANPDFSSRKRLELRAWFKSTAPSLSEAYEGAVVLLKDPAFPGRIHFIAHAIRDITDRLAFVLDTQLDGQRVSYETHLDPLIELWPTLNSLTPANPSPTDTVAIPLTVALRVDGIVEAHRQRKGRPSNFDLLFQHLARQNPNSGPVNARIVADFKRVHKWFMERAHLRKTVMQPVPEATLTEHFELFESILHSFVGDYFTGTAELDHVLQQANR